MSAIVSLHFSYSLLCCLNLYFDWNPIYLISLFNFQVQPRLLPKHKSLHTVITFNQWQFYLFHIYIYFIFILLNISNTDGQPSPMHALSYYMHFSNLRAPPLYSGLSATPAFLWPLYYNKGLLLHSYFHSTRRKRTQSFELIGISTISREPRYMHCYLKTLTITYSERTTSEIIRLEFIEGEVNSVRDTIDTLAIIRQPVVTLLRH